MKTMRRKDQPGLWWQFLELVGMTWPGHADEPVKPEAPPRCASCHNKMSRADDGRWRCAHHPNAASLDG